MRRAASVVLLFLGGWLLVAEMIVVAMDTGKGPSIHLGVAAVMLVVAAVFLLLGMWASPGNRFVDLGATIITAAVLGGAAALTMILMIGDPHFIELLPPDNPARHVQAAPVAGVLNLLVVGVAGWALYRFGARRGARRG